jgi:hypothetical protein
MAPPASGAHGTCPACHTLDMPLLSSEGINIRKLTFSVTVLFSVLQIVTFSLTSSFHLHPRVITFSTLKNSGIREGLRRHPCLGNG